MKGIFIIGASKPKNCASCPYNVDDCKCKITGAEIDRDDMRTYEKPCPIHEIEM